MEDELLKILERRMGEIAVEWKEYVMDGNHVEPLAPSTLDSKIRKGSSYPDTPLMDSGDMVNSIKYEVGYNGERLTGRVYSDDPKFFMHEYGLGPPARPTLNPVIEKHKNLLEEVYNEYIEMIKKRSEI